MDSGNRGTGRDEPRPGYAVVHCYVPVELKYLILTYQQQKRFPSFSWAVRTLFESHPALAQLAATLYTESRREPGKASESENAT